MPKFIDLTGQRFDRLVVTEYYGLNSDNRTQWLCSCDCGNKTIVTSKYLKRVKTKSCGCIRKEIQNIQGQRFGRLIVIERNDSNTITAGISWLCQCDCGKQIVTKGGTLRAGRSKSCGCLMIEKRREARTIHGHCKKTNANRRSKEYSTYWSMKNRCYNPKDKQWHNYGGRGIIVCDRWLKSFQNFFDDMGQAPGSEYSIDRIDPNGNYEPGNTRWSTPFQQSRNRRNIKFLEFQGETKLLTEWAKIVGINISTLHQRLKRGWTVEKTLTYPVKR